jgi:LPXTG-site transpeptidase (sortase) family protein
VFGAFVDTIFRHPILASVLWSGFFIVLLFLSLALGIFPKLDTSAAAAVATASDPSVFAASTTVARDGTPTRIIIERIGVDALIENPASTDIDVLNEALLSGAVHYPGSGDLNDTSNLFLFGHSTGFRIVNNEAYKTFNGLANLAHDDLIRVQSNSREYIYRVVSVSLVDADAAFVTLSNSKKELTLSTCNVFGEKQERYVVHADFVGDFPLDAPTEAGA